MTASKVMSAIKVDMCRRQQQRPISATAASAPVVASPPNVLDVIRAQRRRGASARVCLFGAPEPGATRALYDQMLQQQQQLMLNRYQFDIKTERYVGEESLEDGVGVDQLQQRLQGEQQTTDAAAGAAEASPSTSGANAADDSSVTSSVVSPVVVVAAAVSAAAAGRVKPTKSTASLRHTKPYDKPTTTTTNTTNTAVRPITEFFRKSKKTCPTATAAVAKLQASLSISDSDTVAVTNQ